MTVGQNFSGASLHTLKKGGSHKDTQKIMEGGRGRDGEQRIRKKKSTEGIMHNVQGKAIRNLLP